MNTDHKKQSPGLQLKKSIPGSGGEILLSSASSRRKLAWKRLRSGSENRGMTQDQVTRYLQAYMKRHYQKVRKEGALTFDKVQRYLDHLAKTASSSLSRTPINPKQVTRFAEQMAPVLEEVASKQSLTEEDIVKHSAVIRRMAETHATNEAGLVSSGKMTGEQRSVGGEDSENVMPERFCPEGEGQAHNSTAPVVGLPDVDEFLEQELIPVGLEEGAPTISAAAFFEFPLASEERGFDVANPFAMHLRYLEMVAERSRFSADLLERVKSSLSSIPVKRYSRYFDIFPDSEFDDAPLMVVFSQWKNDTLKRLLIAD